MLMTYRFLKAFRWRAWSFKYQHFFPLLWSPLRTSAQGRCGEAMDCSTQLLRPPRQKYVSTYLALHIS